MTYKSNIKVQKKAEGVHVTSQAQKAGKPVQKPKTRTVHQHGHPVKGNGSRLETGLAKQQRLSE